MKKKAFYTNNVDVYMPEDIYTQENTNINEVCLCHNYYKSINKLHLRESYTKVQVSRLVKCA